MKIRKGERKDIPALYHLIVELAVFEKEPDAVKASVEDYYQNWEKGVFEFHVLEFQNQISGIALYYLTFSTWRGRMLYLEDFIVTEKYRRSGLGQSLFEAVLQEAKSKRCKLLKWQVLDWNKPALNFYIKNNAIIEKNWWNGKIILD